jgi:hypothetical protein
MREISSYFEQLKNEQKLIRVWYKGKEYQDCDYLYIKEVLLDNGFMMGLLVASEKDQVDGLEYLDIEDIHSFTWYESDQEESV